MTYVINQYMISIEPYNKKKLKHLLLYILLSYCRLKSIYKGYDFEIAQKNDFLLSCRKQFFVFLYWNPIKTCDIRKKQSSVTAYRLYKINKNYRNGWKLKKLKRKQKL